MYPDYFIEYPNRNSELPFYMKRKLQRTTPLHRHDFVELTLVLGGHGTEVINGAQHRMMPGTMVMLLPYQVHQISSDPDDPLDLFICNFALDLMTELGDKEPALPDVLLGGGLQERGPYVRLENDSFDDMRRCFFSLWKEYNAEEPFRSILLKAQLYCVLAQFARSHLTEAAFRPGPFAEAGSPPSGKRAIWPVISFIYQHYLEPLTLDGLSERFQLHPSSLSEWIHTQYGIHFTRFLHELRVRHACSLLLSTDMPIAEVAEESGFGSYSSFVRIFQKTKGLSPRAYRLARSTGALQRE